VIVGGKSYYLFKSFSGIHFQFVQLIKGKKCKKKSSIALNFNGSQISADAQN